MRSSTAALLSRPGEPDAIAAGLVRDPVRVGTTVLRPGGMPGLERAARESLTVAQREFPAS